MKKQKSKQAKKASKLAKAENLKQKIITVKNAEGDPDTTAEIIVHNKIDYTPKVSVIIPVYNVEKYLPQCLDSVVKQTLKEIEIICVDDGSTDNSLEILKEYAAKDNRITVIAQKNLHAGVARNAGLAIAKGEYLSFLDSDDFFELNMLEETYNIAEKEKTEIVFYQYKKYNNQTGKTEETQGINISFPISRNNYVVENVQSIADRLFTICNPMPWNKLLQHKFIKQEQIYFQSLKASNDVYFSLVSLACANNITLLYKPYVYYRYNRQDSLKNNRDKSPLNFYDAYKGIYQTLWNKNIYEKYKTTFLTSLMSSAMWTVQHTDLAKGKVKSFIKEQIIPEFCINKNKSVFSKWMWTNIERVSQPELIVSLTSFPARIETVNQTIESLLNQTLKADKVILWLASEQFPNKEADLPKQLLDLREKGLTIDWYHDIRSYKKLIPTLKKYPDAVIVTADDDNIYSKQWLEKLYNSYSKHPECIHCHRTTKFYYNNMGFQTIAGGYEYYKIPSYLNKLVGLGGVLYPPHCFYKDILNEDLIKKLAPTNDDQWFWVMASLNGYKTRVVENPDIKANYILGTQEVGLTNINDKGQKLFWKDFTNLISYYPEFENLLLEENKKHKHNYKINIPYKKDLEAWYKRVMKQELNLDNPKTFNEKIQWLKLYDSTPIKTRLADKYLVRDWVKEKIGEQYLVPLLGVYDKFEDIDFAKLPDRFVIKCNHGCGWNIIVKDKSKLDLAEVKQKLDKWMHENFAFKFGYELHYRDIQPKIIIEKFIENQKSHDLYDYKFWCFNGKVEYIQFLSERNISELKMAFYDRDWNKQTFVYSHPLDKKNIQKPDNLKQMLMLAEKLSEGFPYVRVDFYRLDNGTLYFGEMTFTSASGDCIWNEKWINNYFGNLIKLPKLAYDIDSGKYYKLPKKSRVLPWLMLPFNYLRAKCLQHKLNNLQVKQVYKQLSSFRIDVKNLGTADNSLEVIAPKAVVNMPVWLTNTQGKGCVVSGTELSQSLNLKAVKDGKLQIFFRGPDKRFNNVRYPLWIDYKSIKIDGKEILSAPVATWHDKPFKYEMPVKDGQNITVEIKQQPHQYSVSELKDVILKLNPNNNYIKSDIAKIVAEAAKTYKQPRKPKAVAEIKPSAEEQARQQMLALLKQSLSAVQAANKEISSLKATVNLLQKELAAIKIEQVNTQKMLVDEQTLLQKRRKLK